MSKTWQRERKNDPFYKKAKATGYRARSAFKLKQLNDRFRLLRAGDVVVDLGAAPGGWTQVAVEVTGDNGTVVGVDLDPIKPVLGATFIQGDMTHDRTVRRVLERLEDRAGGSRRWVDVVISDMAPNITGNYTMDQANSYWLCMKALEFAEKVLKPGGHFVCKIFEGEDFTAFRDEVKERFGQVKTFSPPASRKESSEVYLVGRKYRAEPGDSDGDDDEDHDVSSNEVQDAHDDAEPKEKPGGAPAAQGGSQRRRQAGPRGHGVSNEAPPKRSVFDTSDWDDDGS